MYSCHQCPLGVGGLGEFGEPLAHVVTSYCPCRLYLIDLFADMTASNKMVMMMIMTMMIGRCSRTIKRQVGYNYQSVDEKLFSSVDERQ